MTAARHGVPLPRTDRLSQPYWEAAAAGSLLLQRCATCGRHQHFPRRHCIHCDANTLEWATACGRGTIHTFSVIHRTDEPPFASETPFAVAVVDLEEGPRLLTNIRGVDPAELHCGMSVQIVFEAVEGNVTLPQLGPASPRP